MATEDPSSIEMYQTLWLTLEILGFLLRGYRGRINKKFIVFFLKKEILDSKLNSNFALVYMATEDPSSIGGLHD